MKAKIILGNYLSAILFVTLCVIICDFKVSASGVFEIRIDEFVNQAGRVKLGQCCEGNEAEALGICTEPCRTSFHICFTHFQSNFSPGTKCTFGSAKTQVLGSNTIVPEQSDNNLLRLKFNFTWPKTFALVIEATHEQNDDNLPDKLIARMEKNGQVSANRDWITETQTQHAKILRYSYRVKCDQHYYGDVCSKYCRPRDYLFGRYTCDKNGDKVCLDGYESGEGTYCTKPKCLPGCNTTHGFCERPNECRCRDGWEGELCDKCTTMPGCLHGTCETKYKCNCEHGWGGLLCNLDLNYCTNHQPCKNGARCSNVGHGTFECECLPGFVGSRCEIEKHECDPDPCQNGAKCTVQKLGGYTCECPQNFFGSTCDKTHVTCAMEPCKNGGVCIDDSIPYRCKCKHGFRGDNCEIVDCSSTTCLNGGVCHNSKHGDFCSCPTGYFGRRCQQTTRKCGEGTCMNGGKCLSISDGIRCECINGYSGPRCEVSLTCQDNPCKNGGMCTDLSTGYQCKCRNEFTGRNCDEPSPCYETPCENKGRCTSYGETYSCTCGPNHTGKHCEKAVVIGLAAGSLHSSQYDDNKNTRIIVLTKNDKSGLNTAQWIAVCFGAAFLLLIFVAIAICVAYQRHGKSSYIGGRSVKSQPSCTDSRNQETEVLSDRSSTGLLYSVATLSKTGLIAGDLSQDLDGFSSEIIVVPTNTLSPARKSHCGSKSTEFLSISPENPSHERREKRASLNLSGSHHGHKYLNNAHSHYDIGCVKRQETTSNRSSSCSNDSPAYPPNRSRSCSRGRRDETSRLPTYQEACREDRVSSSQIV